MSGSSLDGLDVVYCEMRSEPNYSFKVLAFNTFPYPEEIQKIIANIEVSISKDYENEHVLFDELSSISIKTFMEDNNIEKPDFIASHGHTIFHFPEKNITCQIGNGKIMAKEINFPVICNFRQADMDAGGQGAPLVPIADVLFFPEYSACLNIGGIANISFDENGKRIGFDICAANQLLNFCAQQIGLEYDDEGSMARTGKINEALLRELNAFDYFDLPFPKSMDNNFIRDNFFPILSNYKIYPSDKLATTTEHIAYQISRIINKQIDSQNIPKNIYSLLVTGGGAYNSYLLRRIEQLCGIKITLPDNTTIQFKEAIAMCLMGMLRWENKPNFLPSVTGARIAVSGGDIVNVN
jgi:anhydro-N-acetylmuramic acid kinase